jgi:enamine deaminase RidA (YjgF/YER057c/UK114 family)
MVTAEGSRLISAEQRLKELGIKLPVPPEPFGTYAEAVQSGNLLFLSGMLPTEGRVANHFALDTAADEIASLVRAFVTSSRGELRARRAS